MTSIHRKYADLLTHYCLQIGKGDRVYISSSHLAEPLLQELIVSISQAGGHPVMSLSIAEQERLKLENSSLEQLDFVNPLLDHVFDSFECYLAVRAPFNLREGNNVDGEKRKRAKAAMRPNMEKYFARTASGEMRRSLCQFPTQASAQEAGMSLKEYEHFVYQSCYLLDEDPVASWQKVHDYQQKIVDHLNGKKAVHYKGPNIDIHFNTEGRTWINSDGKNNMPSGEVFTAPVEDSVNGHVRFSYPSIYQGQAVEGVELEVKDGEVIKWTAEKGQEVLDHIFSIEGARRFGEAAVGTNMNIQRMTNNILFDEKIGGTIHMAIGQSYGQCGGKNQSSVHWDMITDMKDGGEITVDGEKVYQDGKFLIA
jgi:aminopeptidase